MPRAKSPLRMTWIDPSACTVDYRLKIIGRLPFFKHLSPESIGAINARFRDRSFPADKPVYLEGDPAEYLYLIAMGRVKLVRNAASGREVVLDILHGGEYFGSLKALGTDHYSETAITQTEGCILQISGEDFERILKEHPDVSMKVLQAVAKRLDESRELIQQLSTYTVEQRLASALLRLAGKLGEPQEAGVLLQLPLSGQDLASMTGATVESVSRVMSRFAKAGLIRSGRKWVAVADRVGLEQVLKSPAVN